jgi:uncharacterized protein (TIGR03118 family)
LEDRCLLSAGYVQTNLASDLPGVARVTDPHLINPWGISFSPSGPFWFGENGSGASDLLDGNARLLPLVVSVPSDSFGPGSPTGTVFNGGPGFTISEAGRSGPSIFLFAGEDGTLSGWNGEVDSAHALLVSDNSSIGAVYKGLGLARSSSGQSYLYAADFGRGTIDVFDEGFQPVHSPHAFQDATIPAGYAPFNVQNINNLLFVTYARRSGNWVDDAPGAGHGVIDVYSADGSLVRRFASGGVLNSPWGLALAPNDFGPFSGDLLVGNTGDGYINAFDPQSGAFLGSLTDTRGTPITIPHLWGLSFGNGHVAGAANALFFTAGLDDEQHGLFGAIQFSGGGPVGTTAGDGVFNPTAPGEALEYPLPPENGPTLQGTSTAPTRSSVVLLPVGDSALVLAPTLSAGLPARTNGLPVSPATQAGVVASPSGLADLRMPGGASSHESTSLGALLDLNSLRQTASTVTRPIANASAESNDSPSNPSAVRLESHVADVVAFGGASRSNLDRVVSSHHDERTYTGQGASQETASSYPIVAENEGTPTKQGWLGWVRKLSLPMSVVLVWNGLLWCHPRTRSRLRFGRRRQGVR